MLDLIPKLTKQDDLSLFVRENIQLVKISLLNKWYDMQENIFIQNNNRKYMLNIYSMPDSVL